MGLIIPFGFLAAAGESGWDPTLGGTLTIQYWWDFTNEEYVAYDGSDQVTAVTPRQKPVEEGGAADLRKLDSGGPSYTDYPIWDSTLQAVRMNNACLLSSSTNLNLNWELAGATQGDSFTQVTIAANNNWQGNANDAVTINSIRNEGFDNLCTFEASARKGGTSDCSGSGDYFNGFAAYDGGWGDGRFQRNPTNPSGSAGFLPNMVSSYWDGPTGNNSKVTVNNHDYCTFNLDPLGNSSTTRPGLVIGAAPGLSGASTAAFSGSFYHHVIYSGSLTQTQTNDLYTSWVDFYLA